MLSRSTTAFVAGGLLAGLLVPAAPAAATQPDHYARADLARDTDAIRAVGISGVRSRVTADGRSFTATSGVADLDRRRPVSPDGYFRIGSTNKTLVATVVLQLVAEGRLGLDDTVERWLPGVVRGHGNNGAAMTVRQLLNHTSGIYDGNYPSIDSAAGYRKHRYDVHTPEQIVAAALRHAPTFAPGRGWSYSNTGYVLVGMVIERVTGRAWHREVDDRIVRRLGLRHTRWPGTSPRLPRPYAEGYTRFTPGGRLIHTTALVDADASGGYLSTTADLDRFLRALIDGTLLDAESRAQMQRTVPVGADVETVWPGARYGLGIFSRPLPCGHLAWIPGGDQLGYRTRLGITADGRRSVVVSMSTQFLDSLDGALAQEKPTSALIDHALCDA